MRTVPVNVILPVDKLTFPGMPGGAAKCAVPAGHLPSIIPPHKELQESVATRARLGHNKDNGSKGERVHRYFRRAVSAGGTGAHRKPEKRRMREWEGLT